MAITADWYVDTVNGASSAAGTVGDPYDSLTNLFANETILLGDVIAAYSNGATNPEQKGSSLALPAVNGGYYDQCKIIGVNASYNNDGTQYVIDGQAGSYHAASLSATDWIFENITFYNAGSTYHGMNCTGQDNAFINCRFNGNGGDGFYTSQTYNRLILCEATNNTGAGINIQGYYNNVLFCTAHHNGDDGITYNYGTGVVYGNICYDNSGAGIFVSHRTVLLNNTIDQNTEDGVTAGTNIKTSIFIANRITNNSQEGIDYVNFGCLHGWNYIDNNTTSDTWSGSGEHEILDNGTGTDIITGGDTSQGYTSTSEGSEDFNLASGASLRRTELQLWPGR